MVWRRDLARARAQHISFRDVDPGSPNVPKVEINLRQLLNGKA